MTRQKSGHAPNFTGVATCISSRKLATSPRCCGAHRCHKALLQLGYLPHPPQEGACSTAPITEKKRKKSAERDPGKWKKGSTQNTNVLGKQVKLSGHKPISPGLLRASHVPSRKLVISLPVCGAAACEGPTCSHLYSLQNKKRGRSWPGPMDNDYKAQPGPGGGHDRYLPSPPYPLYLGFLGIAHTRATSLHFRSPLGTKTKKQREQGGQGAGRGWVVRATTPPK